MTSRHDDLLLAQQLMEADREVARIMEMSDAELVAELVAEGLDPSAEAEQCREILRRAEERVRARDGRVDCDTDHTRRS